MEISHDSEATLLWCGGIFKNDVTANLLMISEFIIVRILKIG